MSEFSTILFCKKEGKNDISHLLPLTTHGVTPPCHVHLLTPCNLYASKVLNLFNTTHRELIVFIFQIFELKRHVVKTTFSIANLNFL